MVLQQTLGTAVLEQIEMLTNTLEDCWTCRNTASDIKFVDLTGISPVLFNYTTRLHICGSRQPSAVHILCKTGLRGATSTLHTSCHLKHDIEQRTQQQSVHLVLRVSENWNLC